jgi:glycerol kinase
VAARRAAILGLTRGSGRDEIVTATLQAVAYQTHDLVSAMAQDGLLPSLIRVDGGMVANEWFLQFLADILGIAIERPANVESTVLGAAYLAGLQSGVVSSTNVIEDLWQRERLFEPAMSSDQRESLLAGWSAAVRRVRSDA